MEQEMQAVASASTQHAAQLCVQVRSPSLSLSFSLGLSLSHLLAISLSRSLSPSLCFAPRSALSLSHSLARLLAVTLPLSVSRSFSFCVSLRRYSNRLGQTYTFSYIK